jgi:ribosomal protein L4|eukprot:COSAG06_NODE_16194_length_1014_cov_100.151913_1_plen_64_part_00
MLRMRHPLWIARMVPTAALRNASRTSHSGRSGGSPLGLWGRTGSGRPVAGGTRAPFFHGACGV